MRRVVGLPSSLNIEDGRARGDDEEGKGNGVGAVGYINHVSGFAHAGKAMQDVMAEVVELCRARNARIGGHGVGGVEFHRTGVAALVISPTSSDGSVELLGVTTTSGAAIHADLIILATGAWTPSLLDLRGRAKATGQVLAYLPLHEEEAAMLKNMKVLLNLGTGMFAIPPVRDAEGVWELKLARHGYGYENVVEVELDVGVVETGLSSSEKRERGEGKVRVQQSLPSQSFTPIPQEAEMACRGFLKQMFPPSSSMLGQLADRPFASTRLCWYTDTPKGDFLVDFHPRFRSPASNEGTGDSGSRNLLIATGGSGHAFKFLPVIGEKIVARLEGRLEPELAGLWEWKRDRVDGDWGEVDGSRGGVKGMKLEDEWAKGRKRESRL